MVSSFDYVAGTCVSCDPAYFVSGMVRGQSDLETKEVNRDRSKLQLIGIVAGNYREFVTFAENSLIAAGKGFQKYGDRYLGDGKEYFYVANAETLKGNRGCEVFYYGSFRERLDSREVHAEAEIQRRARAANAYKKDEDQYKL